MKIRHSFLPTAALLIFAGAPAGAATLCVNPNSASCQPTIQGAVNLAAAGDTIRLASGVYNENVTVPGALIGLTIRGGKKAIIDGDAPLTGTALTVNADGVTLKGFSIHNGQLIGLQLNGDDASVRSLDIAGLQSDCINVTGDSAFIHGSQLRGCGNRAIEVNNADDIDILNNTISQCGNSCLSIAGDDFVVERNEIHIAESSNLIEFNGDDGEIVNNRLSNAEGFAIFGTGDDMLVSSNQIENAAGAMDIVGANPVVIRNRTANFNGAGAAFQIDCVSLCVNALVSTNRIEHASNNTSGLAVSGAVDGMLVERNQISDTEDSLIDVSGAGVVTVRRNAVATSGGGSSTACILVAGGTGHSVEQNKIANCHGDGVFASGTGHTIDRNDIRDTLEDGISVDTGTNISVTDNRIRGVLGVGLETENSTGTTITGNKVASARMGLCDEATGTVRMDNSASNTTFPDQLNSAAPCPID